ncbi:DUF6776 family protein [Natronospira sp.]|uniref:DUF6776 family protein n=1 Tax=Natronospira sp. TaxID=2024970 RepID=UPI00387370B4
MTTHSLVVKAYRPWRYRITIAILLLLAITAVIYAYQRGLTDGGYFQTEARAEREAMQSQLEQAAQLETRLRDRLAVLERAQEVNQAARENLRQDLLSLQDEIQGLEEELAFYRGIVSPEDGQSGLQIQEFSISPGREDGEYRFTLMLIQAMTHDRRVEGEIRLAVEGRQDDESLSLDVSELGDHDNLAFSFRYFQGFDGRLRLPEGFEPEQVSVTVSPRGRNRSQIEESFEWPELER